MEAARVARGSVGSAGPTSQLAQSAPPIEPHAHDGPEAAPRAASDLLLELRAAFLQYRTAYMAGEAFPSLALNEAARNLGMLPSFHGIGNLPCADFLVRFAADSTVNNEAALGLRKALKPAFLATYTLDNLHSKLSSLLGKHWLSHADLSAAHAHRLIAPHWDKYLSAYGDALADVGGVILGDSGVVRHLGVLAESLRGRASAPSRAGTVEDATPDAKLRALASAFRDWQAAELGWDSAALGKLEAVARSVGMLPYIGTTNLGCDDFLIAFAAHPHVNNESARGLSRVLEETFTAVYARDNLKRAICHDARVYDSPQKLRAALEATGLGWKWEKFEDADGRAFDLVKQADRHLEVLAESLKARKAMERRRKAEARALAEVAAHDSDKPTAGAPDSVIHAESVPLGDPILGWMDSGRGCYVAMRAYGALRKVYNLRNDEDCRRVADALRAGIKSSSQNRFYVLARAAIRSAGHQGEGGLPETFVGKMKKVGKVAALKAAGPAIEAGSAG